jgi:acetyltransferase
VDLRDETEVVRAFRGMPRRKGARYVVQELARGARETILGMVTDPAFGPLVMFGLGGVHVEVMKDVAFKVHPLSDLDARELLGRIRGAALLDGVRGAPPADRRALVDALLGLSALVGDHPEILEIEINPFLVGA